MATSRRACVAGEPCWACAISRHDACRGDPCACPGPTDPARQASDALGAFARALADLVTPDGYRALLPELERLRGAVPDAAPLPVPSPRRPADDTWPTELEDPTT